MAVARQSEALMSHTLQGLSAVKHLTLDQVAVDTQINRSTINKIENGEGRTVPLTVAIEDVIKSTA